ncbi:MAG: FAD-binding protein, partial [Saprospiraceae bacterium]|nr:FAD-binding protein [Saprospiraceae bacterium]
RRSDEDIKRKLPSMYHQFKVLAELDITQQPMEVGPTCHYFMGGIRVEAEASMSSVQGLFACGECAAGLHGANRLGGNSLSDLLVFGNLAGKGAADYAKRLDSLPKITEDHIRVIIRKSTDILNREGGKNPYLLHEDLQANMQANVSIIRNKEDMEKGIVNIERLREEYKTVKAPGASQFNSGWHEAIALECLLLTSEAVAKSALLREESRGAHTREDFPGESQEWGAYNIIVKKGTNGQMLVEKIERGRPDPELERIAKSNLEDLEKEVATEKRQ